MEQSMQTNSTCWFVGATYNRTQDQTQRFLESGIWENGYKDKYLELVKSIKAGDRIAIKAAYTRKKNLPFDNHGKTVSAMAIKAIGVVTGNEDDGRHVSVRWTQVNPVRE
jgi:5-methylcytosine-specific restriction protein B